MMRRINCELLLDNHQQENIKLSFHDSVNLFLLSFIAKKSIFRQLTPVWILPTLMYATLRFISSKVLYRYFANKEFRLFFSLLCGCYSLSEGDSAQRQGSRRAEIKSQHNGFFCTCLVQINLTSQLSIFRGAERSCIDR